MTELTLEERKSISLEILKYLKKVCDDNDIHYYLAYGTLLGSVRHNGFIPWDDDIDIWIPFDEYPKLMKLLTQSKHYELLDFTSGIKWKGYFSKLSDPTTIVVDNSKKESIKRGISVDIFPLYNYMAHSRESLAMNKCVKKLKIIANYYNKQYSSVFKKIFCKVMLLLFWNYKRTIDKLLLLNNKVAQSNMYCCFGSIYNDKDRYDKQFFGNSKKMLFEKSLFSVPNDFDGVLTRLYGNYHQLPPIDQRISNHDVKAYRL